MSSSLDQQIKNLKQIIAEMETQRAVLGDAAVDASLVPFQDRLAELEARAEAQKETPPEIPVRQRKLVTLLYMDVVGSTAMTQDFDPEDTMEILDKAILRLAAPIEAHGGHVTRYTGDGFKAIFGDPTAREDDPEQAVRAGLELRSTLAQPRSAQRMLASTKLADFLDRSFHRPSSRNEFESMISIRQQSVSQFIH